MLIFAHCADFEANGKLVSLAIRSQISLMHELCIDITNVSSFANCFQPQRSSIA